MTLTTPEEHDELDDDRDAIATSLARMERGLQDQERRVRAAINGFSIFAVLSVVVSLGMLVAVATKLQGKSTTTRVVTAAPAPKAAVAAPRSVGVALREYTVTPTSAQASAGKVTFKVRNAGSITHEFVVLKTAKPAGSLLKGAEADEAGNVGEVADLKPGASKTLTLNLKAGHYALICNLPGHYTAGQHTDFTVR